MNEPLQWGAESLWQQLEPLLPGLSVEVVARSASTNTALLERARVRVEPATDELVQVRKSVESAAFGRRAADVQPCLLVAEHQTG
ncbi:MAG: biotin--[acetyl-CoA-carboxylase] ligase, partial [Cytophagales bacterium]|nr:biotin--[acetyl-CoA-carboxylase] ligase [Rhizobacter sp.]